MTDDGDCGEEGAGRTLGGSALHELAELGASGLGEGEELGDDFRVSFGDVGGFGEVSLEVIEDRSFEVGEDFVLFPEGKLIFFAREVEFPIAKADGLEVFAVVVKERNGFVACDASAGEGRENADAIVDAVFWKWGLDDFREGWKEVHGVDVEGAFAGFGDRFRPMDDEGDAVAAFEADIFCAAIGFGECGAGGAVVGGEDDDCVFGLAGLAEGPHHFADAPV